MNKIFTFILPYILFASCNSKGDEKQPVIKQDTVAKKVITHRIPEELFLYHLRILDSVAQKPMEDTMYNCCTNSVEFMEESTRIEADVDGNYFGPVGFKKKDLKKWHEWYDKEYRRENGDTCRKNYLNEVFNTTKGKDYLLVVNAKEKGETMLVALSRVELSHNLEKNSLQIDDSIVAKIDDGTFVLPIDDSSEWFTEIKYFKEVDESKSKGEQYFIKKYFDENRLLKEEVPFKYTAHIIQVLFNWSFLITESECGGGIYFYNKQFCK